MAEKSIFEYEQKSMNTNLLLRLGCDDKTYAYSASVDCFASVDHLEGLFSQYITESEIDILNNMGTGRVFKLAEETLDCLVLACNISQVTGGALDVCMGEFFLKAKNDTTFGRIDKPRRAKFEIDYENLLIRKTAEGRVDLGSIGKGFAIDEIVKILQDPWEIDSAFISFRSSIFALGKHISGENWTVNLTDNVIVKMPPNTAVGCSGTATQGIHICDGRTGEQLANPPLLLWTFAESAAVADGFSTAFMGMARPEIEKICQENELSVAIKADANAPLEYIGKPLDFTEKEVD